MHMHLGSSILLGCEGQEGFELPDLMLPCSDDSLYVASQDLKTVLREIEIKLYHTHTNAHHFKLFELI